jgi:hypothetical protein
MKHALEKLEINLRGGGVHFKVIDSRSWQILIIIDHQILNNIFYLAI